MRRFLWLITFFLLSVSASAQTETFGAIKLTSSWDQIRFEVGGENRYWFMSKTAGANDKAFALYSPDDGYWFTTWKEGAGDLIQHKGNFGLGIYSPFSGTNNNGMHIARGWHSSLLLGLPNSGYGGIVQTSDEKHRVFIGANLYDDQVNSWQNFQEGKGSAGISLIADQGNWGTKIDFYASEDGSLSRRMQILGNGRVAIGDVAPQAKLHVSGDILADEIRVEDIAATNLNLEGNIAANQITVKANGNTADFVFSDTYNLKDLTEVENYIKTHKHLPDIPSAEEMEASGVNLAEMNKLLLQKVEELTLYIIDLKKCDKEKEHKLKQFEALSERIEKIELLLLSK